jgi:hypothetical protein
MTAEAPKWLRPVDPLAAARLPVRIDWRLRVDEETAYRLRLDADPLLAVVTVFMTTNYDALLAAEIIDDARGGRYVLVRSATGDETAYLFSSDDEDGDRPVSAGCDITWRQAAQSDEVTEPAVKLWSGEVLLADGRGLAGPFYMHQDAAKAWALSAALDRPSGEVFGAQLVCWQCAESQAELLLAGGAGEFRRLNRFWSPPVRSGGVSPVALPDMRDADVGCRQ